VTADTYKKLAEKLDALPNRYIATESGVEIRLLEKLFTPEEARIAAEMSSVKQTAAEIASLAGVQEKEARQILKGMVRKEMILFSRGDKTLVYRLMPFVVGIYEYSLPRMNEEIATLIEEYIQETQAGITGKGPSVHRVIPVQESIDFEMEVYPYEKASDLIENAKAWGVRDCICRVQKDLIGDPCDHPVENCLIFAPVEGYFENSAVDRAISKDESLQILREAEEAGLVHTTGNYQDHNAYICNCCTCSCGILRGVAEFNNSSAIAKADFLVVVDDELCVACGDCVEHCQFDALNVDGIVCEVDSRNCVGCGLCVPSCPEGAMVLVRREVGEVSPPPATLRNWGIERAQN